MAVRAQEMKNMDGVLVKRNPRTGEVLYTITEPTDAELDAVMQRAWEVQRIVARMSVHERIAETQKLKRYLIEHKQRIAQSIVAENGKSLGDALVGDVFTCLDLIHYYEKYAPKFLADEKVPTPIMLMGKASKIMYCPIGPVLVISPWNYPLNTSLTPALCAFLAGNAVIIKPSEWTPMRGLLDTILYESGFLKDAMQVVFGGRETGRRLILRRPAKVFFTGSVRGGKEILAQCAPLLIPAELELGGKDPMIVFADANLERCTNGAVWGAMNNTGQGCTSVERCFVQRTIYDAFVEKVKEKAKKLTTLDTFDATACPARLDLGCITTPFQLETIRRHIRDAQERGASVWMAYEPNPESTSFPPTIVTNVTSDMLIQREETFGPVMTVMAFDTEEEAVALANDTAYGLSSSVWTADLDRAERVARALEAGNVCINDVMVTEGNSALPFGGVKNSGIGRYKGRVGLHSFCNIKSVMVDKGTKNSEANWYPYTEEKYRLLERVIDTAFERRADAFLKLALTGLKLDSLSRRQTL